MIPEEPLAIRLHGHKTLPALIYLPGLHGDWTLVSRLRGHLAAHVRWIEFIYPPTTRWSLTDYAQAILNALQAHNVQDGWILAESFGSQILWPLLLEAEARKTFHPQGVILAGGFVRHPWPKAAQLGAWWIAATPQRWWTTALAGYARLARWRQRRCPISQAALQEFLHRRSPDQDRLAMVHRLRLIANNDPRPIARQVRLPVYHLTGLIDPIVPAPPVRRWLQHHCPGYRASRTILRSDHNVLGHAPDQVLAQILNWMG